ncbi:DUF4236 domain-containing protein [Desulfocicer niacini]
MGLYLRKSFKAGPVRLNLSKRGLGASVGVKGLRVGTSASGRNYVHAGRGGLYYRKNLSSGKSASVDSGGGLGSVILVIIGIVIGIQIIKWLTENPAIPIFIGSIGVLSAIIYFLNKSKKTKILTNYKKALDDYFVLAENAPDKDIIAQIVDKKYKTKKYSDLKDKINKIEKNVYTAVIDKIIDDQIISEEEHKQIDSLEKIVSVPDDYKLKTKKEIFRLLYLDIIADHEITAEEMEKIKNYLSGLGLHESDVREELKVIREILRMQKLSLPLRPVEITASKLQKTETAYYNGKAKVLSRKKAKKSAEYDYEYSVRRQGQFIVTDKRLLVISEGVTAVKLKDILDIDVDLDNSMIVVSKDGSSIPVFVQTNEPIYSAKMIDLLVQDLSK